MKTAAPIAIPIINPAIETIVAAIPSLLPCFQDMAPKTMPRIPKSGGTNKKAIIPQTSPVIARPCLLSGFDD